MNNTYSTGAKIVLVGECNVGKTSILNRLEYDRFLTNGSSTIGSAFVIYDTSRLSETGDTSLVKKLYIWDTSGNERYRSIVPLYYRSAVVGIIVFDITDYSSFAEIEYWISQLENNFVKTIIIVGNKIDLEPQLEITLKKLEKINTKGYCYIETSAKTGKNIKELFRLVIQEIEKHKIINQNDVSLIKLESKSSKKTFFDCCKIN